jgi:hypothetical protein
MRVIGKLIAIIIILGILLSSSAYIILYTNDDTDNGGDDTEPPEIFSVSGNLTVTAGQTTTITVDFTDNVDITVATLYYKTAESVTWDSISILNGSAAIAIPDGTMTDYYYYIVVDDEAGNGPVGVPSADGSIYFTITIRTSGDDLIHTVFIEEATAVWCSNCPNIAAILHSLYEKHTYQFYYISMINGSSAKVWDHLKNDYNIFGFPSTFIDGGYKVIVGGNAPESDFIAAITAAQSRTVPKIKLTVTTDYNNDTHEVTANAVIENFEDTQYTGQLKLYLTEIVSHLNGYDSKPYQFGFLDYLLIEDVTLDGQSSKTFSQSADVSAYDYENLMVIGVVFNSKKETGYAQPPDKNTFDAYFADATDASTLVEGGNLPPQLQITSPQKGKIYLSGKPILEKFLQRKILGYLLNMSLHNTTRLYGKKIITVNASDDSSVTKVEFYIDGKLIYNDTEAPYEYSFTKIKKIRSVLMKSHTLNVIVYDDSGKSSSAELNFKARI